MTAPPLPPAPSGALRALLDAMPIRAVLIDAAKRHIYVNPVYSAMLRRPPDRIIGRTVAEMLGADSYAKFASFGDRALAGETVEWTGWYAYPEGERWVTRVYLPRYAPDGGIDAYYVFVLDATETVVANRRAAETETFRSAVIEQALDCVIAIDERGAVVEFNPAAVATFGISREAALGRSVAEIIIPPEMRSSHSAGFARFLGGGAARMIGRRVEVEAQRADGGRFPAELALAEVRLGERRLFVAYLRDLSQRRRTEDELSRQREALYQSEKLNALGSLLAGVAHELNNPLAIVLGQASMLAEKLADPADVVRAERVRTAAERCARIVKTFLAMARRRPPERRTLAIGDVVRAAQELLAYGLRADGVDIDVELPADLPAVDADSDQIHQVVANLIVNAQQALRGNEGERRIRIAGRTAADGHIEIEFADNGPGIAPDHAARLFEPFFTTKPQGEGTGIGLTMCRSILQAHGGEIAYHANPDGGAVFVVRLPVDRRIAAESQRPAVAAPAAPVARGRILVIDDEELVGETLVEFLDLEGFAAEAVASGAAGIERLRAHDYSGVFVDMRMPGIDGRGVLDWIAANRPGLAPTSVLLTGDALLVSAGTLGEAALLAKPFERADLKAVLTKIGLSAGR